LYRRKNTSRKRFQRFYGTRKGLKWKSFFAAGKKDWNGKPGPTVRPGAPVFLFLIVIYMLVLEK
jgi:hypothetical protein